MHQALYRKYRPSSFDEVCGQQHITDVLRYEVENGKVSHAYLFCGSRGTGKTTCAKIMAKAVNCLSPVNGNPCGKCQSCLDIEAGRATDVVEMDAASNNGVDNIREICEEIAYSPAMLSKKVYIIDEVHMLSSGAFNALLKTIEEPPEHGIFILATTELHKIPATIVSRCQRFDFRRIDMRVIGDRLLYIAKKENIELDREAALLLARQAQGGMRDAIGLLELCAAGGCDVNPERVGDVLGLSGYDAVAKTSEYIADCNVAGLFDMVSEVTSSARDIAVFWQELTSFVRDMLVSKYAENPEEYLDLTAPEFETLQKCAGRFTPKRLLYLCTVLDDGASRMSRSPQTKRMTAEMALLRMSRPELEITPEALSARIGDIEDKLSLMRTEGYSLTAGKSDNNQSTGTDKKPDDAGDGDTPEINIQDFATSPNNAADTGAAKNSSASTEPLSKSGADSENLWEPVRDISEAVGRLDGANRGLAGFLMSVEAFVSPDGKHLRLAADGFAADMLGAAEAKLAVADAFALAKITDGRAEVQVVKKAHGGRKHTPADELFGF